MGLITGLFRTMRKKLSLTQDTDMGAFRDKIKALVEEKDTLDEGAVTERVTELLAMTEDLPDGEDKEKLKRYLEDFKSIKDQDADVAMEASKAVADLFEKLDKDAMETDLGAEPAPEEEKVEEEAEVEVAAPEDGEPAPEEEVKAEEEIKEEETGDAATEVKETVYDPTKGRYETKDEDPDPEYSLEEIYQFIKKRMAEDAEAPEEEVEEKEEETVEEETEAEDECGTKDHGMPGITLGGGKAATKANGGLDDLMKIIKGERNGL